MTLQEFITKFNINLNKQQLEAVQSVEKPTLLLAVPGSGKTTVLITRLGYMIYCLGIRPEEILTVTYTVAATNDMRNRFATIFGDELVARLEFRTINGICAKIIGYYGRCVGKKPFELVTDEGYKTKLLSAIYTEVVRQYPTESDLKNISTLITYIKNMQLSKNEINKLGKEQDIPLLDIYNAYCEQMKRQSLMDYDDQMVYALTMLKVSSQILGYFQEMYKYICVDEAQDTSKIQHQIIAVLANKYKKIFMVGDEDQSIYGFRAAYPEALLSFEKNYADANVLLMEENFRSNAKIVDAADGFIQKNKLRHEKHMKAFREAGTDIQKIHLKNRRAQYTYLAKVAENTEVETAVLYRDNESIIPVVDLLERKGISYRIKNADLTFFTHRVVMDIKNIIRFAMEPANTEIFMQIYYKISTYMSKLVAIEACRISQEKEITILDAALDYGKIPAGTRKSVKAIQTHLNRILEEDGGKAIYRIIHFMGYQDYLEKANIKDSKLSIIKAIAYNEPSVLALISRLDELATLIKEKPYDSECKFILSTIHSSKGLEYDKVYIMDAVDGIFPENVIANYEKRKAKDEESKEYEEERRLYYVGVTRAKNELCIFEFDEGSTFTNELLGIENKKSRNLNNIYAGTNVSSSGNRSKSAHYKRSVSISYQKAETKRKTVTESEYADKIEEIYLTGTITHKKYGLGRVIKMSGDLLEIEFEGKVAKCKLKFMMEHSLIE
ncbi:ATP-dependent helicase [Eubacterium sp.]|uniref:ATP-dependent helicase n=1 Tax=Eubacterium sp. TaxID=142586 RepID=UPI00399FBB83